MKRYALIKNSICKNIAVFNNIDEAKEMINVLDVDDVVSCERGFGIGDMYVDGVWKKSIEIKPQEELTIEERLKVNEDAINFLLGL